MSCQCVQFVSDQLHLRALDITDQIAPGERELVHDLTQCNDRDTDLSPSASPSAAFEKIAVIYVKAHERGIIAHRSLQNEKFAPIAVTIRFEKRSEFGICLDNHMESRVPQPAIRCTRHDTYAPAKLHDGQTRIQEFFDGYALWRLEHSSCQKIMK